jgi:4-hydroxy-tetrahydrodipicolinate reductase
MGIRMALHGASGRMGSMLVQALQGDAEFELAAALVSAQSRMLGQPIAHQQQGVFSAQWPSAMDLIIDFSHAGACDAALEQALARRCALVSGSTGLSAEQLQRWKAASAHIPILWASNFSLGVAVLGMLVEQARALLPADYACAIVESHHSGKRDAPSGTALTLAECAKDQSGLPAISSVRAGHVVGDHSVFFLGPSERVELTHRADQRRVFAEGALRCGKWLVRQSPGWYCVRDALMNTKLAAQGH